ncbi:hypothetical protein K2X92_05580 [Candidatus Gracilibacteria bacterium]|nr:hypothetical protein [Candidatus Gracilibacteria bacterium]
MKNPTRIQYKKHFKGRFSILHRNEMKVIDNSNYTLEYIKDRNICLRTREIIDEISQIMMFVKKTEELGFDNSNIEMQINFIQARLRTVNTDSKSIEIISIMNKYLTGIKNFSLDSNLQGIFFYKQLFEGTISAIVRELTILEREYS